MKTNTINKLLNILPALLGLTLLLTPYLLAPVCNGLVELKTGKMTFMRCHFTGQAELVLGALLLAVGLILLIPKIEKRWLGAVITFIGLAMILVPQDWAIGICAKDTMACHTTAHWVYAEGILTMILGIGIWSKLIKEGAE